ncbi:MAG: hypothetical protein HY000_01080 [Planctomycetes bacterium]|nr:hypothetical protein [Planctomycetota bacterium]
MRIWERLILNGQPSDSQQGRRELRSAVALWSCLFLLIFAVVVGRATGAALFLNHYGGRELALVYVIVGLAVVAIIYGLSWATHGIRYHRVAVGTILTLAIGTAIFRLLIAATEGDEQRWVYGALYVFLETFALVTTMQVWSLANSSFSVAQAKRLYVFIATGGILGSVCGGLTTRSLEAVRAVDLLWIVVGLCPPMIVAIRIFERQARNLRDVAGPELARNLGRSDEQRSDPEQAVPWIRHPVLRRRPVLQLVSKLSLLTFFTAFTTNLIDFYFKTYADRQFHGNVENLTHFFGNFYLLVGCASLATQLLVTPVIVQRASVFGGLALMPVVLSFCTGLNLLGTTLLRATLLKLFDSGFAHSVYRSCTEMLYTRLPPDLTGDVKLVSEGVAGRAGLVVSGLVLFLLAPVLTTARTLALISVLLVCWFGALLVLRRSYRTTPIPLGNGAGGAGSGPRQAA